MALGKAKGFVVALICLLVAVAAFIAFMSLFPEESQLFKDMIDSIADALPYI